MLMLIKAQMFSADLEFGTEVLWQSARLWLFNVNFNPSCLHKKGTALNIILLLWKKIALIYWHITTGFLSLFSQKRILLGLSLRLEKGWPTMFDRQVFVFHVQIFRNNSLNSPFLPQCSYCGIDIVYSQIYNFSIKAWIFLYDSF